MRLLVGPILGALLIAAPRTLAQPAGPPPGPDAAEPEEAQEAPEPETETEPPSKPRALPGDEQADEEPEPQIVPPARDALGGHVMASAGVSWVVPFGSLEAGTQQTDFVGSGPGFSLDVGIGVSRVLVLGLWGETMSLGSSDDCPDCSASSLAAGAFIRYHLVQGLRFDPWLSAGVGYRATTFDGTPQGTLKYAGFDLLRLQVGGDWYPASVLGIGPLFELGMGIYTSKESSGLASDPPSLVDDSNGEAALHWRFVTGLRLTLDVPGRR